MSKSEAYAAITNKVYKSEHDECLEFIYAAIKIAATAGKYSTQIDMPTKNIVINEMLSNTLTDEGFIFSFITCFELKKWITICWRPDNLSGEIV